MLSIPALREHLKLGAEREVELEPLRDVVLAQWESATGRPWSRVAGYVETITPDLDRQRLIFLSLLPVETITKVEERTSLSATAWSEILATDYELVHGCSLERLDAYWGRRVRVTYTGGYVAEQPTPAPNPLHAIAPADVRQALLVQAQFLLARFSGDRIAMRSQAFETGSTSYETADLHPSFVSAAARRRRKV